MVETAGPRDALAAVNLARLSAHLGRIAGCPVTVSGGERLSGGAIQQNWKVHLSTRQSAATAWRSGPCVLRTGSATSIQASGSPAAEFAWMRLAFEAGVPCPEPLAASDDAAVAGAPFLLMRWADGVAAGHRLVRDDGLVPDRAALAAQIGCAMARLHRVRPAAGAHAPAQPTAALLDTLRDYLDTQGTCFPVLEWGLRRCQTALPAHEEVALVHRDFRTGNYLVHDGRLVALLDWEFAAWANPMEDLGWFTAHCWRFGSPRVAGGIGPLESFLHAYNAESGRRVAAGDLLYWQLLAHLRWAVIALQQADRHLAGGERSLELALTGRLLPAIEQEVLALAEAL